MKEKKELSDNNIIALQFALNNQINWQKYAETKLLLLTTISGTSILSLNSIISGFSNFTNSILFKSTISIFAICTFVSFLIGLLSLIEYAKILKKSTYSRYSKILISWRYVVELEITDLIKESKDYDLEKQREDLMVQHSLGSFLTYRKYKRFNLGAIIYSVGIIVLFTYFILNKVFTIFS